MKNAVLIILAAALFLWITGGMVAAVGAEEVQGKQYARLVDELIFNCEQKGEMGNTAGDNLREEVSISLMKASFYRKNRDQLIDELAEAGVKPRMHTVTHFLNERFFAIVRDNDADVAEAYSAPDEIRLPAPKR